MTPPPLPPGARPSWPHLAGSTALACAAGFIAVWLPWFAAGARKNMIDGMRPESLLFLLLSGFLGGLTFPRNAWIIGPATMAAFPVIALAEVILDPKTHNLLPLEFIIYGLMALPGLLGALGGRALRRPNDKAGR
ncbi:MAG: hypothetical protein CJBNEKGG_01667 [Prosthecobacter sp.]|nr:hypothetical protein [Prosthecobacter sp.]